MLGMCFPVVDPGFEEGRFLSLCGNMVVESKDKGSGDAHFSKQQQLG